MRQSKLFYKTKKDVFQEIEADSHRYLVRGDYIDQLASGIYSFLPLGFKVQKKIENIIREEMIALGAQELFLPVLIPKKIWLETKRWEKIDPPLFKLKDRHGSEFGMGSTHEEVVTHLVRQRINSYKDLPFSVFQIQNKFRNEMRATSGLLRVKEFIMKDLYSFHEDKEDAIKFYEKIKKAYFRIFERCGLKPVCVEADSGTIGGELSHEFMVISEKGEDRILICDKCHCAGNIEKFKKIKSCPSCKAALKQFSSIEIAHAFYLGKKYTEAMGANFVDKQGKSKPIIMGCYGIGLGRLMGTLVEENHDENGIIWPKEVAPFDIHLIQLEGGEKIKREGEKIYNLLQKTGFEVLFDERNKSAGEKFAEADLIGIPLRIIISEKTMKKNSVEIQERKNKKAKLVKISQLDKFFKVK